MERISSSCNFKIKSHPDKSLFKHLNNVQDLILKEIKSKILNFGFINDEELIKLSKIIAISHDFGKATKFFQDYLNGIGKKSDNTNHSYLSALFAFYLAQKAGISKKLIPMFIVDRHHSNLNELADLAQNCMIESSNISQIQNIDFQEMQNIYEFFLQEFGIKLDFQEFRNLIIRDSDFCDVTIYESYDDEIENKTGIEDFFLTLFLFSLLIDSDKLDAGFNDEKKLQEIKDSIKKFNYPKAVDNFKERPDNLKDSKINPLRESIYQDAVNFLDSSDFDLNQKIYSINVPTGTGKTFTGLSFALKLKDRLVKEKGFNPKIIYCLPFTSIIDQNYQVIKKIFEHNNIDNLSVNLMKHHHLAETSYKAGLNEEDDFDTNKSSLLIESWQSSLVVTTFVQFFHSLISNRNRNLKKFHNIANSIVILDEVQAVPYYYWHLIKETLKSFSELFNTYFILVTATQPMIFDEEKNEIIEIIKNKEKYFKDESLNRIKLINETDKRTLDNFKELILNDIKKNYPDKSFLIILNTIKSSQEIYKFLDDKIKDKNTEILYLSTTILPFERLDIIKKVKDRKKKNIYKFVDDKIKDKNTEILYLSTTILPFEKFDIIKNAKKVKDRKKRIILVSTQVVEAGVDIDLDIVYRDMAPLDCIFQAAGRCNRNKNNNERGIVKIFNLVDENNKEKPYSNYVYEQILLESTKTVLSDKKEFSEREFLDLAKNYYGILDPNLPDNERIISNGQSRKILESMKKLDFSGLKEFQLIKNVESYDFFIELNDEARQIREKIENIMKKDDFENKFDKKYELMANRKEFYKYVVSVRLKKGHKINFEPKVYQKFNGYPYYIQHSEYKNFYEENGIGFYIKEDDGCLIV